MKLPKLWAIEWIPGGRLLYLYRCEESARDVCAALNGEDGSDYRVISLTPGDDSECTETKP